MLKMEMEQIQSALHLSSCVLCVGNVIMAPLDLPRHNNAHLARLTMQGEARIKEWEGDMLISYTLFVDI